MSTGFPQNTMDAVLEIVEARKDQLTDASMAVDGSNTDNDHRKSKVLWLGDVDWLRHYVFEQWVQAANADLFGFDLTEMSDIQYTEYHGTDEGKYDWHYDTFWADPRAYQRKLSVSIVLNDPSEYEGGEFQFEGSDPISIAERGTVLAFPGYLSHRVKPITSGVRKSLVFWFEGPRFR